MCKKVVGWEVDKSVDGPHNLVPVTCEQHRRRVHARIIELEMELALMGQVRLGQGPDSRVRAVLASSDFPGLEA